MKANRFVLLTVVLVVIAAGAGFWAGSRWGAPEPPAAEPAQTFYAAVTEVRDGSLLVEGLEVNDINHRGAFTVPVTGDTEILWRYEPMAFSEIKPGQTFSITYAGPVQESDPAGLTQVTMLQLLDDEK